MDGNGTRDRAVALPATPLPGGDQEQEAYGFVAMEKRWWGVSARRIAER